MANWLTVHARRSPTAVVAIGSVLVESIHPHYVINGDKKLGSLARTAVLQTSLACRHVCTRHALMPNDCNEKKSSSLTLSLLVLVLIYFVSYLHKRKGLFVTF